AIALGVGASSSKQVIQTLSGMIAAAARVDARRVFEAVLLRERLSGTGVGEGVAIPHALVPGLDRPVGAFVRLDSAADFSALDGRPADLVFMLLAPTGKGGDHLKALARISRFFRRGDVREKLRRARSEDEIYEVFAMGLASSAA